MYVCGGDRTSFLSEEDGAMGGVAAGVEEGGETGEELCALAGCFFD